MRRILLVACAAALALSACREKSASTPSSAATSSAPLAKAETVQPDAGASQSPIAEAAEPMDPLALPSEGRSSGAQGIDHLARAHQLETDGDAPGALVEARRALLDNGQDEEALTLVGQLAKRTHAPALAAGAYARLATLNPQDTQALVQAARLWISAGQSEQAVAAAEAAAERDTQDPEVHQVWGRALFNQGKLEGATEQFQTVLDLEPDHGYALNNLGLVYLRSNQNTEAVEVLAKAAEVLPDVAYVMNNYGVALERTGQIEEARAAYARATDLAPRYVKALVNVQRMKHVASAEASDPASGNGPEDGDTEVNDSAQ